MVRRRGAAGGNTDEQKDPRGKRAHVLVPWVWEYRRGWIDEIFQQLDER